MTKITQGNMLTGGADIIETDPLRDRFLEPPFSVLRGNSGDWLARKRQWKERGLASEQGRDVGLMDSEFATMAAMPDESIFDPALCEVLIDWYSAPADVVFDPFAGGSVRGIVASTKGRHYIGYDCRAEQVAANEEQRHLARADYPPRWVVCDSATADLPPFDMMLSCPPYGNLETYSQQRDDISRLSLPAFIPAYAAIIKRAFAAAKHGAFAVFVVANYRDLKGMGSRSDNLIPFVSNTITAFKAGGWHFFDEIINLQPIGSAPQRAGAQFKQSNKVVRVHQNCLVFVKGRARTIKRDG